MGQFSITGPDGKKYTVTGETAEGALAALQKHLGAAAENPDGTFGQPPAGMRTDPQTGAMVNDEMMMNRAEGRVMAHPARTRASAAFSGMPFVGEWIDEGVNAITPGAGEVMNADRAALEATRPGQAMAMSALGGVLGSLPVALAAGPSVIAGAPAGLLAQALYGGGIGLAGGAIEGASSGAGRSPDDRMGGAKSGAIAGGAAGGLLGALSPAISKVIATVWERYGSKAALKLAKELGVENDAAKMLGLALEGDAPNMAANIARAGNRAMLADAGPNATGLLDFAIQKAGPGATIARDAIEGRAASSGQDFRLALDQSLGAPQGFKSIGADIRQASAAPRNAAYDLAYSTPIDYAAPAGQAIESLFARIPGKTANAAIASANARMKYDGGPAAQIMATIGRDGTVTFKTMPNVMQLDYIKRAFQEIAQNGTDPITGKMSSDASFAARIARDLRDATKDAVPEYGTALETAADSLSQESAAKIGRDLFKPQMTREMVADAMAGATGPEKQAAALALRSQIDEAMANAKAALTDQNMDARAALVPLKDMTSAANREKLAMILGGQQADALLKQADTAFQSLAMRAALASNSATFTRQNANATLDAMTAPGAFGKLEEGKPIEAARAWLQGITGATPEATERMKREVMARVAAALTSGANPAVQAARLALLNPRLAQIAQSAALAGQTGAAGITTGAYGAADVGPTKRKALALSLEKGEVKQ